MEDKINNEKQVGIYCFSKIDYYYGLYNKFFRIATVFQQTSQFMNYHINYA